MKILFVISELRGVNKFSPFVLALADLLTKSNIEICYFKLKGHGAKKYIKGVFDLNRHLETNHYDLIHAHYNYSAYCATFQNKIPVIVSFLGSDLLAERKGFAKVLNNYINQRLFKKVQGFICKTEEMCNKIPSFLMKVIIPNGVDLNIFIEMQKSEARQILKLADDKKYILFPADPTRSEKNYQLCLESVELVKKENPNAELLTIYNIKQAELNLYYNAADVLLVTSRYEGGVNVVKEAMACNCPVVTTRVGDVEERLKDVKQSFICDSVSNDLAKAILLILQSDNRSNGREKLLFQKLDDRQVALRVVDFYKNILNR